MVTELVQAWMPMRLKNTGGKLTVEDVNALVGNVRMLIDENTALRDEVLAARVEVDQVKQEARELRKAFYAHKKQATVRLVGDYDPRGHEERGQR